MPAKSETMSENSRSNFQSYLNNRIYPALGNYRMYEITPTMISQFLPFLQEEGLAHGTVEKLYVIIRLIFKMAFLGDLIENVYHADKESMKRAGNVFLSALKRSAAGGGA